MDCIVIAEAIKAAAEEHSSLNCSSNAFRALVNGSSLDPNDPVTGLLEMLIVKGGGSYHLPDLEIRPDQQTMYESALKSARPAVKKLSKKLASNNTLHSVLEHLESDKNYLSKAQDIKDKVRFGYCFSHNSAVAARALCVLGPNIGVPKPFTPAMQFP